MEVNSEDYNEIIEIMASHIEEWSLKCKTLENENEILTQENIKLKMTPESDHNSDIEENPYYKKFITKSVDEIKDKILDNQYVSSDDEDSDDYDDENNYVSRLNNSIRPFDRNRKLSEEMRKYITKYVISKIKKIIHLY